MHLRVSGEQIWMTKVHPPRSTLCGVEVSFGSPLFVLPLAVGFFTLEGGGGGGSRIGFCCRLIMQLTGWNGQDQNG
jgi:hypothetical protein